MSAIKEKFEQNQRQKQKRKVKNDSTPAIDNKLILGDNVSVSVPITWNDILNLDTLHQHMKGTKVLPRLPPFEKSDLFFEWSDKTHDVILLDVVYKHGYREWDKLEGKENIPFWLEELTAEQTRALEQRFETICRTLRKDVDKKSNVSVTKKRVRKPLKKSKVKAEKADSSQEKSKSTDNSKSQEKVETVKEKLDTSPKKELQKSDKPVKKSKKKFKESKPPLAQEITKPKNWDQQKSLMKPLKKELKKLKFLTSSEPTKISKEMSETISKIGHHVETTGSKFLV